MNGTRHDPRALITYAITASLAGLVALYAAYLLKDVLLLLYVAGLLAVAYVGLGLLKGLADFGNYLVALWIRVKAVTDMQADLFRHLLTLSLSFFTRQRTGDLLSRFNSDTRAATAGLETIAGTLFSAPILILIYVYLLATASPTLVGAALGAGVFHYVVTRGVRAPIRRLASDEFSLFADVAVRIQEVLLSIRTVKSFAFAIVGAEYVLRWLPRGTHDWRRFLRPSELARHLRGHGLEMKELVGVSYDPIGDSFAIGRDCGVNYMSVAVHR